MAESVNPFAISCLGPCEVESPLAFSSRPGDQIACFVSEGSELIADPRAESWRQFRDRGGEPPCFEVAGPREMIHFEPDKVWAAIVTCGGLCPGTNDVIRGLVMELYHHYGVKKILGFRYGFQGMATGGEPPIELTPEKVSPIHRRGGSFLGSSRGSQDPSDMMDTLQREKVDILFTIGGDGTQRGALQIAAEARNRSYKLAVVGIPKTIDNDLMHVGRTFGFETAFSIARDAVTSAHAEAVSAWNGIAIIRLMGRHSGYIAAMAALASGEANFVFIPEVKFGLHGENGFFAALDKRLEKRKHALIVVAEGAGQELLVTEKGSEATDASGNVRLSDIGVFLREAIQRHYDRGDMKPVIKYIDPTYLIRSAPAHAADSVLCVQLAQHAVHAAMGGRTDCVVGLRGEAFIHVPIQAAVGSRNLVDPNGELWRTVLEATGQPIQMVESV